jgi:hypothetical protein
MSNERCLQCGSTEGVLLGPSGEVLSCLGCDKLASEKLATEKRVTREDEIDKAALSASSRSTTKDAVDLGAKIAGVTIAAAALFKQTETSEKRIARRMIEPLRSFEDKGWWKAFSQPITLVPDGLRELAELHADTGLTIEALTAVSLGLLKCVFEERKKGNKLVIASQSEQAIYELILPV